jgi:hypothetical protein
MLPRPKRIYNSQYYYLGVCLVLWRSGENDHSIGARWRWLRTGLALYFLFDPLCCAVVKVPPSVGCVKYKAQHIVLPLQILLFLACYKAIDSKMAGNSCGILRGPLHARVLHAFCTSCGIPPLHARRQRCSKPHRFARPSALNESRLPGTPPQGAELVQ